MIRSRLTSTPPVSWPDMLIIHLGCNDIVGSSTFLLHLYVKELIDFLVSTLPQTYIVWSSVLPRPCYTRVPAHEQQVMRQRLSHLNRNARKLFIRAGGKIIRFPDIVSCNNSLFRPDQLHLSSTGLRVFLNSIKGALEYFKLFPASIVFPPSAV